MRVAPGRRIGRRAAGIETSIFSEITRLAVAHGAVNLGQGFPDFPAPAFIKDAAARAIAADHNQYAPSPGVPRLRRAIAAGFEKRHGRSVDPEAELTIASGATEIICDAILALVDPDDEVILLDPHYDSYLPNVQMAGGVARIVSMHAPTWSIDPDELRAAFGPKTKLIVLNTPHNPTGKVLSESELDLVASLCQEHDVVAVSDEVYSEIVFDGARHVPIATRPGMWDRTITVDSIGKTFSVTGWKIGWAIACAPLSQALRAVHQFVTFCSATPLQEAAADALVAAEINGYFAELRAAYARRRDLLSDVLRAARLQPLPVRGSYFLLADVSHLGVHDGPTFCKRLVTEIGVAAIPMSAFYADAAAAPTMVRFCFAKRDETILAAGPRLRRLERGD